MKPTSVLSLQRISKTFQRGTANENPVLRDLSLEVHNGEDRKSVV